MNRYIFVIVFLLLACQFQDEVFAQARNNAVAEAVERNFYGVDIEWQVLSDHTSITSGIRHIYFQQMVNGIAVEGTESSIHLGANNELVWESVKLMDPKPIDWEQKSAAVLDPLDAMEKIAVVEDLKIAETSHLELQTDNRKNTFWIANSGVSARPAKARMLYVKASKSSFRLGWEVDVLLLDYSHWWEFQVAASTGEVLSKFDRMNFCSVHDHTCEINSEENHQNDRHGLDILYYSENEQASCVECYEVFDYPLESPYFGDRTIVENPADPIASPFGWHDTDGVPGPEYFYTKGNNVDAYEANDNFGYHPEGGITLNFTGFPFDTEYSENTQYEEAAITNLFYWSNLIHDITYTYGFTEEAGNFQVNNYGRGGEENDDIIAFGQSLDRRCNGSFSTPPDGERPLMITNLCDTKDGSYDTTLIAHEWGHGLSQRLSGGGVFPNCLRHKENPMEGWSDWLATILTIREGDTGATPRYIASYLRGHGPNGPGVRFYPYSTNMGINPLTYEDLPRRQGVHRIGAIWGEMIWEMTWALINEYGYNEDLTQFTGNINQDSGNIMALAIVIEGLKLTPCQPGFVDARDGIITAARRIYGREILCIIWDAFAKRGLGSLADQGDPDNQFDGTASYDTPYDQASFSNDFEPFCVEAGFYDNLGGGYPLGGIYSGKGVIDNGNGETFDFDPVLAGPGTHRITYDLGETICSAVSSASIFVVVENDVTPPQIDCIADPSFTVPIGVPYSLNDFTGVTNVTDDCSGVQLLYQEPKPGTLITEPQTRVTMTATDIAGNQTSCEFVMNLIFVSEEQLATGELFLTPNPVTDTFTILNPQERRISSITIWDMIGKQIWQREIRSDEVEQHISIAELSTGTYFVMVNSSAGDKMFRIFKL
ncbi:MAG: M36 family metallopeptidase [Bacteroidota bacterium]